MRFEDLNWFDVEEYIKSDNRLMLVLGACEQHGYLSLLADVRIPMALADVASQRTGVLIAPPISYGISTSFASYAGTVSVQTHTFLHVVEDVVRDLHRQGFRRILVLNGHGGNQPVRSILKELVNEIPDLRLAWSSWWESPAVEAIAAEHGLKGSHAAWVEAFPFTRVAPLPDGVKEVEISGEIQDAAANRELYGDGQMGGDYQASPEIMDQVFEAVVAEIVGELERLKSRP